MTSTPHNRDEHELLDFADAIDAGEALRADSDLERTYLRVQRAMQADSESIPTDLKMNTWENVMSTLAITPERPISNRTRRQRQIVQAPSRPRHRFRWSPAATVALAALLVVASVGAWRVSNMPEESTPPPAPQVAGIAPSGDVAQVVATPEEEQEAVSRSVPIVQHVDEQPFDGPVIWLTNNGDVLYDDSINEVQTIATNVESVQPGMPNVIQLITAGEDSIGKDGTPVGSFNLTYYNLITGETLVVDGTFSSYLDGPLTVLTIADAPRLWSIVNFETMESRSISDITGGQFRSSDSLTVAVSDDFSTIAIGTSTYQSEGSALLNRQSGLPGEVAVIPADLSEPTWVAVPDGMSAVGNISLSPDGTKLAFIAADNFRGGSNMTVSIVDVATGEQLVRTQRLESATLSQFQWVEDGSAFVIVTDNTVQKYTPDGSDPTVIFETGGTINQMPQFGMSNLLHLQVSNVDLSMSTPAPETTQFVILNTATGETVIVDGKPWYMGASYPVQMTTSLAPIPVGQDGKTAVLVHPITGEVYPGLVADVYDPIFDPDFDPEAAESIPFVQPVVTAQDAPVSVVTLADGTLAVFTTTTDSMEAQVVELPAGAEGLQLQLSPGGEYLTAGASWEAQDSDTYFMLDLADPDAQWVQGQPRQMVNFVELTGD